MDYINYKQSVWMLYILFIFSLFLSSCGGGGDGDNSIPQVPDYLSRIYNGYYISSEKKYDPSRILLDTLTYSINTAENKITLNYTSSGDIWEYHYNSKGEYIKIVKIDEIDSGNSSNYSSNSFERYYTYNNEGLLMERTTDYSIDGDIDSNQIWKYDTNGYVNVREYDSDNDGFIDNTITYTWDNGKKISFVNVESDGSSDTNTWTYMVGEILPSGFILDLNSDGSVDATREIEFDGNNNMILSRKYDSSGALLFYFELEYETTGNEIIANKFLSGFYFF